MKTKASIQDEILSKRADTTTKTTQEILEYEAKDVDTSTHVKSWLSLEVLIGKAVLPAQTLPKTGGKLSAALSNEFKENDHGLQQQRVKVKLNDGTALDTLEITHKNKPEDKGYIIHFPGNYEDYDNANIDRVLKQKEFNSVFFNYRGVGLSEGAPYNSQDLINDGIAQVQRLLDQKNPKVPPDLIFLHGFSLGGGISAKVYQHFQQKGIFLGSCYNNRSYESLQKAASSVVGGALNAGDNFLLAGPIQNGLTYYNWDIAAEAAFSQIPPDRKGGAFVEGDSIMSENIRLKDPTIIKYININMSPNADLHTIDNYYLRTEKEILEGKDPYLSRTPLDNFLQAASDRVKKYYQDKTEVPEKFAELNAQYENYLITTQNKSGIKKLAYISTLMQKVSNFNLSLENTNFSDMCKMSKQLESKICHEINRVYKKQLAADNLTGDIDKKESSSYSSSNIHTFIELHQMLIEQSKNVPQLNPELLQSIEAIILEQGLSQYENHFNEIFRTFNSIDINAYNLDIEYLYHLFIKKAESEIKYPALADKLEALSIKFHDKYTAVLEKIQEAAKNLREAEQLLQQIQQEFLQSRGNTPIMRMNALNAKAQALYEQANNIYKEYSDSPIVKTNFEEQLHLCYAELSDQKTRIRSLLQSEVNALKLSIPLPPVLRELEKKSGQETAILKSTLNELDLLFTKYHNALANNDYKLLATASFNLARSMQLIADLLPASTEHEVEEKSVFSRRLYYLNKIAILEQILKELPKDAELYNIIFSARTALLGVQQHGKYDVVELSVLTILKLCYTQLLSHLESDESAQKANEMIIGIIKVRLSKVNLDLDKQSALMDKENEKLLPSSTASSAMNKTNQNRSSISSQCQLPLTPLSTTENQDSLSGLERLLTPDKTEKRSLMEKLKTSKPAIRAHTKSSSTSSSPQPSSTYNTPHGSQHS